MEVFHSFLKKEMKKMFIKRKWTGKWIEPVQEKAVREPDLSFEEMVAAINSGVPSEDHLKCAKHLRRVVKLENNDSQLPVEAVIYASAHGVYDLYVNGKKADDRLLAPETSDYNKLIWYQKYDITDKVLESDRMYIDVLLGDGWWIGRLGMGGSSCNYGDKLGFIMDLELTYPDGSVKVIGSDSQFLSCDSFIRYSDLYIGEMQDGRAFDFVDGSLGCPPGKSIMNDQVLPAWKPCIEAEYPKDVLSQQTLPGVKVIKEVPCAGYAEKSEKPEKQDKDTALQAVKDLRIKNNADDSADVLTADFGQVLAGVVKIRVNAPEDTVITIEHGEVLDKDGNFVSNIKGLYKDQKNRFVCGKGEQTFVPHFTYQGFRYARITGVRRDQILELSALVYATPLKKLITFKTDNEMINALQTAIENSAVSNMISVPTDCPQREKLGWTGDINIFTRTGSFIFDLRDFLKNWLAQVRLDQFPDGEIPVVVPNHPSQDKMQRGMSGGTNSSAAWSDCIVFMPLNLYKIYGDISFLQDNFDAMEKWMSYVQNQTSDSLWIHRFHFGDWLIPSLRDEEDGVMKGVMATADITGSCYYSLACGCMEEICGILGKKKKAAYYRDLKASADEAIVRAYVYDDGKVGVHAGQSKCSDQDDSREEGNRSEEKELQGLYVVVLMCGAIKDPELKDKVISHLVRLIEENGYTLDCGFSSVGFLLDVLYDNGHKDAAYKVLMNTDAPSWLYMIKNGATTIWENWLAVKEDGTVTDSSYNHYAYGCVGDFIYRHMAGLQAAGPGFKRILLAPDLDCGLHECSISRIIPQRDDAPGVENAECAGGSICARAGDAVDNSERKIEFCWKLEDTAACDRTSEKAPHGQAHIYIPKGISAQVILPGIDQELTEGTYDFCF